MTKSSVGSSDPRGVALTFDDGPDPVWTPRMLKALAGAGVRATFFVVAPRARARPSLVQEIVAGGHKVAFHCDRHVRHDRLPPGGILADAEAGLCALRDLGFDAVEWRTPWGVVTRETRRVAAGCGLRLVGWTADSEDWRGDDAGTMLRRVEPGLRPGAVVLMHDAVGPGARRDNCAQTVALVGPLVEEIRARGLRTLPAAELSGEMPEGNPGGVSGV